MPTYDDFEHDCPQTYLAASREVRSTLQWCYVIGCAWDDPRIVERVTKRLLAAGYGLVHLDHDRLLVTRGEVDVDGSWRRCRRLTRERATERFAFDERRRLRRQAEVRRLDQAARRAAEYVEDEAELEHVVL